MSKIPQRNCASLGLDVMFASCIYQISTYVCGSSTRVLTRYPDVPVSFSQNFRQRPEPMFSSGSMASIVTSTEASVLKAAWDTITCSAHKMISGNQLTPARLKTRAEKTNEAQPP